MTDRTMTAHISGQMIALLDIERVPVEDFEFNDEGQKRVNRLFQRRAIEALDAATKELREKHGIVFCVMPEYIEGMPIEI
jgi:hypothetical protein